MNGNSLSSYNEVMRYTFHVDSNKRSAGTNTDLILNMTQVINKLAVDSVFIVTVNSISVPFSFYQLNINDNLNVLPIYIKNGLDVLGRTTSITLQPGNYNPYSLLIELNTKITTACQQVVLGFTPFTPIFLSTYNPTTGHITFVLSSPIGSEIQLLFSTSTVTGILGNYFGVGQTDVVMTPSTTPSSFKPCVLNPVNYLFLRSSLKQFRNREWVVIPDDTSDIIYRIPIGTQQGTWIQYDMPSEPVYIVDDSITSINFYLTTNLTYEPINLQQVNWSFSFSISEVIRPNYKPLASQLVINKIALIDTEDKDKLVQELQQKKQQEMNRLLKYKEVLSSELPKSQEQKQDTVETPEKTPDELVKNFVSSYSTASKIKDYQSIQYNSIFDPPTQRAVGDTLGVTLDQLPSTEDSSLDNSNVLQK